jgi:hypothetical protein
MNRFIFDGLQIYYQEKKKWQMLSLYCTVGRRSLVVILRITKQIVLVREKVYMHSFPVPFL